MAVVTVSLSFGIVPVKSLLLQVINVVDGAMDFEASL